MNGREAEPLISRNKVITTQVQSKIESAARSKKEFLVDVILVVVC